MSSPAERPKRRSGATGLAIPAGLFLGIGIGLFLDNVAAGTILGLGFGFLGMMIMRAMFGEW